MKSFSMSSVLGPKRVAEIRVCEAACRASVRVRRGGADVGGRRP
jgi:hypothetical protein